MQWNADGYVKFESSVVYVQLCIPNNWAGQLTFFVFKENMLREITYKLISLKW